MNTKRLENSLGPVLALACALGVASAPASGSAPAPNARAAEAAKAFSAELRSTLGAAMAQGGPSAGVRVCHQEAPRIAERVSAAHGVRLGRVGVRSRQPANRLEGWQKALLTTWQSSPPAGTPASWAPVSSIDPQDGTLRWAKAIETEAVCLVCHGPSVEPGLAETIRRLYPDDPAVGFEPGSLRGLLWVEVDPAKPATVTSPDARRVILMSEAQSAALRRQMRAHLERIEGTMLALGHDDAQSAGTLLAQGAAGGGQSGGEDFRSALPEGWSRFARPMHVALGQASEAAAAGDVPRTLRHLGEAVGHCNACHATYRVEAREP
ncbi:c-type heme family protein [Arenimonas caeni]|uniref:Tll0287-like domain-containing protein n=1 Tax=Arenimonas caeni TaxID=2058085 RepID=A0A2P6M8E1_9GAMM|nr:DUF3365 domain-containing protein [Arenimonas caeni]PRH82263.1 hypothetical protein C6N40_08400 [Arenimonas caeni]